VAWQDAATSWRDPLRGVAKVVGRASVAASSFSGNSYSQELSWLDPYRHAALRNCHARTWGTCIPG
jgi:hypothetical protein